MAFKHKRKVIIDPTKCGTVDSVNFVFFFSGTYDYLADVASGGDVESVSGYDIGFYTDHTLTTKLDWVMKKRVGATGRVVFWVRVPALSASVSTTIYLAYGDAAVVTDQSNPHGVFPNDGFGSGYELALSLPNDANELKDSAPFGYDATATGGPTQVDGQTGGGLLFDGSTQHLDTNGTFLNVVNTVTMSCWVKPTSISVAATVVHRRVNFVNYRMGMDSSGRLYGGADVRDFTAAVSVASLTINAWNFVKAGFDGTDFFTYLNGVKSTAAPAGSGYTIGTSTSIGCAQTGSGFDEFWPGAIDEVRISSAASVVGGTPGYVQSLVTAEYNNQRSPGTFYFVGSDEVEFSPADDIAGGTIGLAWMEFALET